MLSTDVGYLVVDPFNPPAKDETPPEAAASVNLWNVMAYSMRGAWNCFGGNGGTGHAAALRPVAGDLTTRATAGRLPSRRGVGSGFRRAYDATSQAAYRWDPASQRVLSYENVRSITAKRRYAVRQGLGSVMSWDLGSDDAQFTLLRALVGLAAITTTAALSVRHGRRPAARRFSPRRS